MNRAYDEIPDKQVKQEYLCSGKIFAGNEDWVIAVNDGAKRIHFTLKEQEQYCENECPSKNECKADEKKDVIDIFSPKFEESELFTLRTGGREEGVLEVDGIIIKNEREDRKTIRD